MTTSNTARSAFIDISLLMILLSNIASMIMAFVQHWSMGEILWIYWMQSVVIGIINVVRILSLESFSTKGFTSNRKIIPETDLVKKQTAGFFIIHYGFFHFIYATFWWQHLALSSLTADQLTWLLLIIFCFFGSHGFSYRYNLQNDFKDKKPNLGTLMFYPYLRIFPMHLIILFGAEADISSTTSLLIFMILKTFADGAMHTIEHHLFRKKS